MTINELLNTPHMYILIVLILYGQYSIFIKNYGEYIKLMSQNLTKK